MKIALSYFPNHPLVITAWDAVTTVSAAEMVAVPARTLDLVGSDIQLTMPADLRR
jgi:hypothetical protein